MRTRTQWDILDSWAYTKDDATRDNINSTIAQFRETWAHVPGLKVATYKRHVRAGGAGIAITAVVARARRTGISAWWHERTNDERRALLPSLLGAAHFGYYELPSACQRAVLAAWQASQATTAAPEGR